MNTLAAVIIIFMPAPEKACPYSPADCQRIEVMERCKELSPAACKALKDKKP